MLQRLREAADEGTALFSGTAEVDEMYIGGKWKNMHASQPEEAQGPRHCGQDGSGRHQVPQYQEGGRQGRPQHKATTLQPLNWQHMRLGAKVHTVDFPS